jgi:hypothetical protein
MRVGMAGVGQAEAGEVGCEVDGGDDAAPDLTTTPCTCQLSSQTSIRGGAGRARVPAQHLYY